MTADEAIEAIARHVIGHHSRAVEDDWENYPEVGEHDWERIVHRVELLAPEFVYPQEAVDALAARADDDTQDQHSVEQGGQK